MGSMEDAENEMDDITLKDHFLTFGTFERGTTDKKNLYELETGTRRFGRKYANMVFSP